MIAISLKNYDSRVAEKVTRLLEVLSEIERHPFLSKRVCLHGGTAINLFMLKAPRLSIDADITYISSSNRDIVNKERPIIEKAIEDVGAFLGYNVTATQGAVAGRTFRFRYRGENGNDYIKIDINYLNRIPIHPLSESLCTVEKNITVTTLSKEELIAGKCKALFDRVAVRDLYDISSLYDNIGCLIDLSQENAVLKLRRTILFYAALSNLFPTNFERITQERFKNRSKQIRDELYPVLHVDDRPELSEMIMKAEQFVSEYVVPRSDDEKMYIAEFSSVRYRPEFLFSEWPEVLSLARKSPSAKWKLINLEKRREGTFL